MGNFGDIITNTESRGKAIIATEQSTTSGAFAYLSTPDKVNVTLPTDGLIFVLYNALWKSTGISTPAKAAIFVGSNQLKVRTRGTGISAPQVTAAADNSGSGAICHLGTDGVQLVSAIGSGENAADVTTGQSLGAIICGSTSTLFDLPSPPSTYGFSASSQEFAVGGVVPIYAAAGTYDVGVKFSTDGTTYAKERKLWVWTQAF